ncbi:MAG: serine/threonine protein kinase [Clostridium sp.]|nr:serine/threonine protein kinase [Clostridium sp.]
MQTRYDRCPNCMQALQNGEDVCPYCGFDISGYEERANCLKPFTVLENKYMLGRVLGVGGFGITYIGWDLNLQTYIAIKEYFPESLAGRDVAENQTVVPNETSREVYDKGLKRYVEEAQNISKFYQLQGIVSVKDFFYANGTAYIVMEYINGVNLKDYLKNYGGRLDEATVLALMKPVFESLYQIHNSGLVHRDISPDNIMVDKDGKIKLIDFGSARGQSAETDKTYTVILKHGYAPSEQYYAKGNQGPWTDIYSLCATMYKMLTGVIPPNSVERMEQDMYQSPTQMGVQVSQRTEYVLSKGLAVKVSDRYQNIGQLLTDLYGEAPVMQQSGNAIPISNVSAAANPASLSLSNQSMHITVPPSQAGTATAKNRKTAYIVIGALAAVLVIGIILFFVLGKKDEDKTTEKDTSTTEATNTDASTDEPAPNEPSTEETDPEPSDDTGYKYVWPTELSDNWHDYQIDLNGTVYQFPIPYSEWVSKGWKADRLPTTLAAGDDTLVTFYMDDIELDVEMANFGLTEADIRDCFILGISIDTKYDYVAPGYVVTMSGGVKLGEATEQDVKSVFGAPDYRYDYDDLDGGIIVSLDYAGDTYEDGMDLEFREDKLSTIRFINTKMPEGFDLGTVDISAEAPEINASYVAPTGPAADRFDNVVTLDGVNYRVPVPASVLAENGWILDTATDDYVLGESSIRTTMQKNGNSIEVQLYNYTTNAVLPVNAWVTEITVEEGYIDLEAVFPGGIVLGSADADFEGLFSDLGDDYSVSDYGNMKFMYAYHNLDDGSHDQSCLSVITDENGVITDITYENRPRKLR